MFHLPLDDLYHMKQLIEALEERNAAQLDSFVDEQDQWDSMDEADRQLLLQKDQINETIEKAMAKTQQQQQEESID